MKIFNNEKVLLFIVIFIAVLLAVKTVKLPMNGTVNVTIMQQKGNIKTLDTVKKISSTKHILVDSIDFLESRILEHPSLGKLGYTSNIFLTLKTEITVLNAGEYVFMVSSDDGFRLKIDDKVICEHPTDRAMQMSACTVTLSKAKHKFELSYFQGAGPMGLNVKYKLKAKPEIFFVGRDSEYMSFKEMK